MAAGHAGTALLPHSLLLRCIGRVAFPLFCFLLVQDLLSEGRLLPRAVGLVLLAAAAEIPFNLLTFGRLFCADEQSVAVSFLFSLPSVIFYRLDEKNPLPVMAALLPCCLLCMLFKGCYGWLGPVLCAGFCLARGRRIQPALICFISCLLYSLALLASGLEGQWIIVSLASCLAAVPILLAGNRSCLCRSRAGTLLFYLAYPLSLLFFTWLRTSRLIPPYFFE